MNISGSTSLYGIIGWPVAHSLSPMFQRDFIEQQQLDAAYLPFPVAPDAVPQALDGLWALGIQGFNVTVPHKETVMPLVHADDAALRIGAVNTVRRGSDGWQATNSDWLGFKAVVEGAQRPIAGRDVLLFGAGGTARAVLHALHTLKPARVYICNRNPDRLARLLDDVARHYPALHCAALDWSQTQVNEIAAQTALRINTTAIGLKDDAPFPFTLPVPTGDALAIDAVYRPDGDTPFTRANGGCSMVTDGLPMLIAQGAASFSWWHDCPLPDCRSALARIEQQLKRPTINLPGWEQP